MKKNFERFAVGEGLTNAQEFDLGLNQLISESEARKPRRRIVLEQFLNKVIADLI